MKFKEIFERERKGTVEYYRVEKDDENSKKKNMNIDGEYLPQTVTT